MIDGQLDLFGGPTYGARKSANPDEIPPVIDGQMDIYDQLDDEAEEDTGGHDG